MDLSKLAFWRKKPDTNVKEAGGSTSSGQITQANVNNFVVKAVGQTSDGNTDFASPEYDLSEIKDAINTDSYIKLAVTKYSQLIYKAGYNIVGQNDSAVEYVESRFRLMSFMTGTPIDIVLQQVADDLVAYSNAFLIKSRVDMTNIGGLQAKGLYDTKPVGGYFRVDPSTMQIKRDASGTVKNYQQTSGSSEKSYKPTDVIHFYIDKEGGAAFGTPRIEGALEDVKLLRKVEGSVLKLIYRFSIPLYQMKIGLPEAGFMATDKEIKEARAEVEKLSDDGILITNERTSFETIGAEGQALDASGYLSYFENRVFAALSLSSAMVGRGGAKQDADSIEEQVHDAVKFYQRTLAVFIENCIFTELLIEGGFNPVINEQDIVHFQFNEINLDTRVKMETHALNQFQGNAIPFEEMRQMIGKRADNVDESRLFANMITHPNAVDLIQVKMGNTSSEDGDNNAGSSSTGSKSANTGTSGPDSQKTGANDAAKNTINPQNQHGTTSANIKESMSSDIINESQDIKESASNTDDKNDKKKDESRAEITKRNQAHYKKNFPEIYKKYSSMRNEISDSAKSKDIVLPLAKDALSKSIKTYIVDYAEKGYKKAIQDAGKKPSSDALLPVTELTNRADKTLSNLFAEINKRIKEDSDREEILRIFDSLEYRIRFLVEQIVQKAYWYAYVKCCARMKIKKVYVDFGTSDDRKDHHPCIRTQYFDLEEIPAFNSYCSCKIGLRKAGA